LPDCEAPGIEHRCKIAGIAHLLEGHDAVPNAAGPDDTSGVMLAWTSPTNPRFNYDAIKQTWRPSFIKDEHGKPLYRIGFWKDSPPTQSELRRNYTQNGKWIQFGAEKWKLPTPDSVDARAVYADDGSMKWETTRQFSWMCDEAKTLSETYLQQGEFGARYFVYSVDPSAQISWLLKLLTVNYRLTPEVAAMLELWIGKDHIFDTFLSTFGLTRKKESDNG
jgi:hypothetical protein